MKAPNRVPFHPRALATNGPATARPVSWRIASCLSLAVLTNLAACTTAPPAQMPPTNASLPMPLQVGADELLGDVYTGSGTQTYVCRRSAERLTWQDAGSEASLFDAAHVEIGAIVAGDYFTAHDDSIFAGRVAAEAEMAPVTLPWQRIVKRYTAGSPEKYGRLTQITSIQRVLTAGGIPLASTCGIDGQSIFVPYAATYLLYRHVKAAAMTGGAQDAESTPVPAPAVKETVDR